MVQSGCSYSSMSIKATYILCPHSRDMLSRTPETAPGKPTQYALYTTWEASKLNILYCAIYYIVCNNIVFHKICTIIYNVII